MRNISANFCLLFVVPVMIEMDIQLYIKTITLFLLLSLRFAFVFTLVCSLFPVCVSSNKLKNISRLYNLEAVIEKYAVKQLFSKICSNYL